MTQLAAGPGRVTGSMRFSVEGWDPSYGTSVSASAEDDDLSTSSAEIVTDVEVAEVDWAPIAPPHDAVAPAAVLFIDGVRRIDARIWIDDPGADSGSDGAPAAASSICASYAAGVICCCPARGAHLLTATVDRGVFTSAAGAVDVDTWAGSYQAFPIPPRPGVPLSVTLSANLQARLAGLEVDVALRARELPEHGVGAGDDLLVVDGPLQGRAHLPRALGFIKTHRTTYLPAALNPIVGRLPGGYRTPVFRMGTSWQRHSWYLRLPCPPGSPWAGVVRVECSAELSRPDVVQLANLSQATLCRYASIEYKDARAPQNLYPIAGLERELRRRLGDPQLLYRALRSAAHRPA